MIMGIKEKVLTMQIFLLVFALVLGGMTTVMATPARADIHFINGWYKTDNKGEAVNYEVINEQIIKRTVVLLREDGSIDKILYSDDCPYYDSKGYLWIPELAAPQGRHINAMKIILGQRSDQPLKYIMNPSEIADYFSQANGHKENVEMTGERMDAPAGGEDALNKSNPSRVKTSGGQEDESIFPVVVIAAGVVAIVGALLFWLKQKNGG